MHTRYEGAEHLVHAGMFACNGLWQGHEYMPRLLHFAGIERSGSVVGGGVKEHTQKSENMTCSEHAERH